jgi:hypothetical protein
MAAQRPRWVERRASRLVAAFGCDRATALAEAANDWQALQGSERKVAVCCDRSCLQGSSCASFAPDVLEGPYRRSLRRKAEAQAAAASRGVMGFLRSLGAYLAGPRP